MSASITDFSQFTGLRAAAQRNDPAALREVAGQFEALFVQTMLKTMREASLGDPIFGNSDQHEMYQGMMDKQLALEMASGKGIGLADMLVRQLGGADAAKTYRPTTEYAVPPRMSAPAPTQEPATRWSDPKAFARDIWPHAERAARKLGIAPEAIVAQAALETGWGEHVMPGRNGQSSLNLFGIKAGSGWQGQAVSRRTLEFEAGVPVPQRAEFRAYDNLGQAFEDYTRFLADNPRYTNVRGHGEDTAGFAKALQGSGYATDPDYADKITRILESPTMRSVMSDLKNPQRRPITTELLVRAQ